MPSCMIKVLVVLFSVTWLLCACSRTEEPNQPLRISINAWPGYAYAYIAQEKGYFQANQVNVELIFRKDIHASNQLFKDGEVDGTFCVFADAIMFHSEGIPNRVVYITNYSDAGDVIIGRPTFRSLADLRGTIVSFEGLNTFSHLFVLKSLQAAGLEETDARFANVPATEVLEALEAGRIDAGHTWQPVTAEALRRGYRVLGKAGDLPGLITDVLTFHEHVVREGGEALAGVVQALVEARAFLRNHEAEAIAIMAHHMEMTPAHMRQGVGEVHLLDLTENLAAMQRRDDYSSLYFTGRVIAEFFMHRGQLLKMPDLDQIIEPRFLQSITKGRR